MSEESLALLVVPGRDDRAFYKKLLHYVARSHGLQIRDLDAELFLSWLSSSLPRRPGPVFRGRSPPMGWGSMMLRDGLLRSWGFWAVVSRLVLY